MVAIADPDVSRALETLKCKLQGPNAHMYAGCEVFSSYLDVLNNPSTVVDVAFIGERR